MRAAFVTILLAPLAAAQADPPLLVHEATLLPDPPAEWFRIGSDVDVHGDTLLAGSVGDNLGEGAVYVYRQVGGSWVAEAELVAPVPQPSSGYGEAVAVHGDLAVAGATWFQNAPLSQDGAVYVFERVNGVWGPGLEIQPSGGPIPGQNLGFSVDVEGDTVVAGAVGNGAPQGSFAHVWERIGGTWTHTAQFVGPWIGLGWSIDLDGDRVAIGHPFDLGGAGTVHVYERLAPGTWVLDERFGAPDNPTQKDHWFGAGVALNGDLLAVGAPFQDVLKNNGGAVYVFRREASGWVQQALLVQPGLHAGDQGGEKVEFVGTSVLMSGVETAGGPGSEQHAAYLFEDDPLAGWSFAAKLLPPIGYGFDGFGRGLAADGPLVVVGAAQDDTAGTNKGAVYVYRPRPRLGASTCSTNPNSTGEPARASAYGSSAVADQELLLVGRDLPAGLPALLLTSMTPHDGPLAGSQGRLCVGAPFARFASDVMLSSELGVAHLEVDFSDLPAGVAFQPGDTWYFQMWFRDFNPTLTSNTTDAVEVLFH